MKSRTVRGSAFFMPWRTLPHGQILPHQTSRPSSVFTPNLPQPVPKKSGQRHRAPGYCACALHLASAMPASCGPVKKIFCRALTASNPYHIDIRIYFYRHTGRLPPLPAPSPAVASILTPQAAISGMNPAVNAVQVFRQILPSEATNQMSKSACRLGLQPKLALPTMAGFVKLFPRIFAG